MIENVRCLKEIVAYTLISICVIALIFGAFPNLNAQQVAGTQILISPEHIDVPLGGTFTITVNLTNFQNLYTWQIVLKYNGTVINCTDVWIPKNNVFSGHVVSKVTPEFDKDYVDGLNFVVYACSLIGSGSVNVDNGILFKANFTAVNLGATTITVATRASPARRDELTSFDSFLLDSNLNEIYDFTANYCTVKLEGSAVNLKPIAHFTAEVPEIVDANRYVILRGHAPVGTVSYIYAYKGIPVTFNASDSKDPDGKITLYIWDFGDGNVTKTTNPVVVHVYNTTGQHTVTLVVADDGDPPLESDPFQLIVVVGLLLERFDWSPFLYGLGVVILVGIVINAVRKVARRRSRTRHG